MGTVHCIKYFFFDPRSKKRSDPSGKMVGFAMIFIGIPVSSSEDISVDENKPQNAIDKCKNTIVPLLKKGSKVIISGRFTHGGHIVSLRSVKSSGVMIQDP